MATGKTQLDLHLSAAGAAKATLNSTSSFDVERAAIEVFQGESLDEKDWDFWKQQHDNRRGEYLRMQKMAAPSAAATPAAPAVK